MLDDDQLDRAAGILAEVTDPAVADREIVGRLTDPAVADRETVGRLTDSLVRTRAIRSRAPVASTNVDPNGDRVRSLTTTNTTEQAREIRRLLADYPDLLPGVGDPTTTYLLAPGAVRGVGIYRSDDDAYFETPGTLNIAPISQANPSMGHAAPQRTVQSPSARSLSPQALSAGDLDAVASTLDAAASAQFIGTPLKSDNRPMSRDVAVRTIENRPDAPKDDYAAYYNHRVLEAKYMLEMAGATVTDDGSVEVTDEQWDAAADLRAAPAKDLRERKRALDVADTDTAARQSARIGLELSARGDIFTKRGNTPTDAETIIGQVVSGRVEIGRIDANALGNAVTHLTGRLGDPSRIRNGGYMLGMFRTLATDEMRHRADRLVADDTRLALETRANPDLDSKWSGAVDDALRQSGVDRPTMSVATLKAAWLRVHPDTDRALTALYGNPGAVTELTDAQLTEATAVFRQDPRFVEVAAEQAVRDALSAETAARASGTAQEGHGDEATGAEPASETITGADNPAEPASPAVSADGIPGVVDVVDGQLHLPAPVVPTHTDLTYPVQTPPRIAQSAETMDNGETGYRLINWKAVLGIHIDWNPHGRFIESASYPDGMAGEGFSDATDRNVNQMRAWVDTAGAVHLGRYKTHDPANPYGQWADYDDVAATLQTAVNDRRGTVTAPAARRFTKDPDTNRFRELREIEYRVHRVADDARSDVDDAASHGDIDAAHHALTRAQDADRLELRARAAIGTHLNATDIKVARGDREFYSEFLDNIATHGDTPLRANHAAERQRLTDTLNTTPDVADTVAAIITNTPTVEQRSIADETAALARLVTATTDDPAAREDLVGEVNDALVSMGREDIATAANIDRLANHPADLQNAPQISVDDLTHNPDDGDLVSLDSVTDAADAADSDGDLVAQGRDIVRRLSETPLSRTAHDPYYYDPSPEEIAAVRAYTASAGQASSLDTDDADVALADGTSRPDPADERYVHVEFMLDGFPDQFAAAYAADRDAYNTRWRTTPPESTDEQITPVYTAANAARFMIMRAVAADAGVLTDDDQIDLNAPAASSPGTDDTEVHPASEPPQPDIDTDAQDTATRELITDRLDHDADTRYADLTDAQLADARTLAHAEDLYSTIGGERGRVIAEQDYRARTPIEGVTEADFRQRVLNADGMTRDEVAEVIYTRIITNPEHGTAHGDDTIEVIQDGHRVRVHTLTGDHLYSVMPSNGKDGVMVHPGSSDVAEATKRIKLALRRAGFPVKITSAGTDTSAQPAPGTDTGSSPQDREPQHSATEAGADSSDGLRDVADALHNGLDPDASVRELRRMKTHAANLRKAINATDTDPQANPDWQNAHQVEQRIEAELDRRRAVEDAAAQRGSAQSDAITGLSRYLVSDTGRTECARGMDADGNIGLTDLSAIAARFGVQIDDNDATARAAEAAGLSGLIRSTTTSTSELHTHLAELVGHNEAQGVISDDNLAVHESNLAGTTNPTADAEVFVDADRTALSTDAERQAYDALAVRFGADEDNPHVDTSAWAPEYLADVSDIDLAAADAHVQRVLRSVAERGDLTQAYDLEHVIAREQSYRAKAKDMPMTTFDADGNAVVFTADAADAAAVIAQADRLIPDGVDNAVGDRITLHIGSEIAVVAVGDAPGKIRITGPDSTVRNISPGDDATATLSETLVTNTGNLDIAGHREAVRQRLITVAQANGGVFSADVAAEITRSFAEIEANFPGSTDPDFLGELNKLRSHAGLGELSSIDEVDLPTGPRQSRSTDTTATPGRADPDSPTDAATSSQNTTATGSAGPSSTPTTDRQHAEIPVSGGTADDTPDATNDGTAGTADTPAPRRDARADVERSSDRDQIHANIAAIALAQKLRDADRRPTNDERAVLERYGSWGGAVSNLFDEGRRGIPWRKEQEQLKELLTASEYTSAVATAINAYFTPREVTSAVWELLDTAGYSGGEVLEPGCGIGDFAAPAPAAASLTGIERDPTSALIFSVLYPEHTVHAEDFTDTNYRDNHFAATIGNVPFSGKITPYDPERNRAEFSLHDYFISKSVDLTAPGGYVAVMTSAYTADQAGKQGKYGIREAIADRADLITAVRLPGGQDGLFAAHTGSKVTTDLLVLRVRETGQQPTERTREFLNSSAIPGGEFINEINDFYINHPDHVLGELTETTWRFGMVTGVARTDDNAGLHDRIIEVAGADIRAAAEAGLGLDTTGANPAASATADEQAETQAAPGPQLDDDAPEPVVGTVVYSRDDDGAYTFHQYSGQHRGEQSWNEVSPRNKKMGADWAGLIDMRDTLTGLQAACRDDEHAAADTLRDRLNTQYDTYVDTFGYINRHTYDKPRNPTAKQVDKNFRDAEAAWRKDNAVGDRPYEGALPAEVYDQLRDDAASPIVNNTPRRKHLTGAIASDPFISSVQALENYSDETGNATKGAWFTTNPLRTVVTPTSADSIADALELAEHAGQDLSTDTLARWRGISAADTEQELTDSTAAFRSHHDPDVWVRSVGYLSGSVRTKLADAEKLAAADDRYAANVDALSARQPARIETGITIALGMTWIPHEVYRDFIVETLDMPPHVAADVTVDNAQDVWTIGGIPRRWDGQLDAAVKWGLVADNGNPGEGFNFTSNTQALTRFSHQGIGTKYGHTNMVRSGEDFIAEALNGTFPTLKYSKAARELGGFTGEHTEAMKAASRKTAALRAEFSSWVTRDPERHAQLIDVYNDVFNNVVAPEYDGTNRGMPGLGDKFSPYSYQLNAVERMVNEPGVLLNHVVGAGKTGTMVMGAMELKRTGKAHQPWLVVPNHLVEQIVREAGQWYPSANILSGENARNRSGRDMFLAQSAGSDWDLVVVPESVFSRISVSPDVEIDYINTKIDSLTDDLARYAALENVEVTVRDMEEAKENYRQKIGALVARRSQDNGITFDATGCDYLIVDEAHGYKNLERSSKVRDLSHPGSQKATDMDIKLDYLRASKPAGAPAVTFSTGTPIANSLAEIWVMMHYLRPDLLAEADIGGINAWGSNFTDLVADTEFSAGGRIHEVERVATYINVGDLSAMCSPFMDYVGRDKITAALPEVDHDTVTFEVSQETKDFIADMLWREETFTADIAKFDNALLMIGHGKAASLDPRLVGLDNDPSIGRVKNVCDNVETIWQDNKDNIYLDQDGEVSPNPGALQIIFCDKGVPNKSGKFSVYEGIRDEMINRGMDPERIRFIHDWDKRKLELFADCNNGKVDVIIGNTPKLGTGANIQARAIALHHVDVPWRPCDLMQQDGRLIRQGNQNTVVLRRDYVAEGTYDGFDWGTLARKENFIEQFNRADRSVRTVEALESDGSSAMAQNKAIATGNEDFIKQLELRKKIDDLESAKAEHEAAIASDNSRLRDAKWAVSTAQKSITAIDAVADTVAAWTEAPLASAAQSGQAPRTWKFGDGEYTDRTDARDAMAEQLASIAENREGTATEIGTIGGVSFRARYSATNRTLEITVYPSNGEALSIEEDAVMGRAYNEADRNALPAKIGGLLTRMENRVTELPDIREARQASVDSNQEVIAELEGKKAGGFAQQDELDQTIMQDREVTARLNAFDSSDAEVQRRAEYAARMKAKGRPDGWSLEKNPTTHMIEEGQICHPHTVPIKPPADDTPDTAEETGQDGTVKTRTDNPNPTSGLFGYTIDEQLADRDGPDNDDDGPDDTTPGGPGYRPDDGPDPTGCPSM